MKKHLLLVAAMLLLTPCLIKAQTGVKIGEIDGNPHSSAMVEIESTNRGLLIPRMPDHTVIQNPATGLMVYNTTQNSFYYYNGTEWKEIGPAAGGGLPKQTQTLADAATVVWDYSQGYNATVTLTGDRTLQLTNVDDGDNGMLIVKQDASGNRKLILPAGSIVMGGGSGTIVLTSNPNATDVLYFKKVGTTLVWSAGYDAN